MGNFEKLSVLVIVVIIVMILVVALYTWSDNPGDEPPARREVTGTDVPAIDPDESLREGLTNGTSLDDWMKTEFGGNATPGEGPAGEDNPEPGPGEEIEEPKLPEPDPQVEPQPKPSEEPTPEPTQEPWMYTVKSGDTLTEISERELGTWRRYKEILALNAGVTPENLRVGLVLKMPPKAAPGGALKVEGGSKGATPKTTARGSIPVGEWYIIRRGDRLERISKRAYGTIDRWPELWARNLSVIDDPDAPPVGAKIFIPK